MPMLSVIVPFHNVAEYLDACLSSLAAQTVTDLEVIMVDDGSTDGGDRIAETWTARDERFVLLRREHGGPGAARNAGVTRARGAFLAFADGDDVVPPDAYDHMLKTLERTGSDVVSGGVQRMGSYGTKPSHLHSRAITAERLGTHISRTPSLLYDVTMWNKVIRRSLWDEHGLSFPEGVLYEDIQLAVRLHCLARKVDVITEPIYLWRERSGGNPSITQRRDAPENLRDRVAALLNIDSFLKEHAPRRLRRAHHHKALTNDLPLYFKELHRVGEEYRELFLERVNAYLDRVPARAYRKLPSAQKLRFHLTRVRRMDALLDLLAWERALKPGALPVVRERLRLYADLPFRDDRSIPARTFRLVAAETRPVTRVDEVAWQDGRLRLAGRAYVPYRSLGDRRHTSKFLVLRAPGRLPRLIRMRSELHPDATARSNQDRYIYDWSGFSCAIDPGKLKGEWRCHVVVRGHGLVRSAPLTVPVRGRPQRPPYAELDHDTRMVTRWSGDQLCVSVQPLRVIATGFRLDGDELELTTRLADPATRAELLVKRGATVHVLPAEVDGRGCAARIPLDLLIDTESADDYASWGTWLRLDDGEPIRVAATELLPEQRYTYRAREVAVLHTRDGNLSIAERTFRPVIETEEWTEDGVLVLRGTYLGPGELVTVLRRRGTGDLHTFPFVQDGDRFEVRLALREAEAFGRRAPLLDGTWDITVREAAPHEDRLIYTKFDHAHLPSLAEKPVVFDGKRLRFLCSQFDTPVIEVSADSRPDERGAYAQRVLQERFYPLHRDLRMRDQLVFVSWKGKQCSDNPRAIADELRRRGDDREHIWVVRDTSIAAPEGATVVRQWSKDYYKALARSKYVIANDDMPASYVKREGQIYLQTWHGTPLKKIGFDIGQVKFASGSGYLDHLGRDVAKWDLMLSPNPFSTPILRGAFRFGGEILQTGYPRNDLLHSPGAAEHAARVRSRLGIPEGKRVVLYAPTWRDDQFYAGGRYRFDQRLDLLRARKEMGHDHVFLIRGHHLIADDLYDPSYGDFVRNVTAYPDITDLYLISDVLITDYSSAMFDFAGTGRPMLFFTYDLESYRDQLRGFYFDFAERAPGPLLPTSDEVLDSLRDLDAVAAAYAPAYRRFATEFHPCTDGLSSARVADLLS